MRVRRIAVSTIAMAGLVAIAACGSSDKGTGGGTSSAARSTSPTAIKAGTAGGKLTVLASGDVDYVDPGLDYYTFGYMVQYAVNRTLYSFKPDTSEKPVPDLAAGPPQISADNKTITVKIKPGVRYAPPVNREVTTKDIKYAFERAFSKEVPSGYAGTYFSSIEGTPAKPNTGDPKNISGIQTPDDHTIVFKLKDASAPLVSQALVMPITVPVPKEYAAKHDRSTPSKYDQFVFVPVGGTHYISLNTSVKPFDNLDVRKAIVAAANRNALRLTAGGEAVGDVAGGWIPPGIPGFDEAGGLKQNTDLDFLRSPTGDPAVAKKYMLAAKQQDPTLPIDADGKWTGGGKLLTIGINADPGRKAAEAFQSQMEQLGFDLQIRLVPPDTMFTKFCNEPKQNVAICPNVSWFKDFADPQSMLDATFNGNHILQSGNVNWAELDVPAINDAMASAATQPVGAGHNQAWAKINHMIAEQAPGIPFLWVKAALVQSKDVVGVASGYITTHDLTFTSLKK